SRAGRHSEAAAVCAEILRGDPNNADALNDAAWAVAADPTRSPADYARSVELARRSVDLDPRNPACWNTLGACLYRTGEWAGAIAAIEQAMALRRGENLSDSLFLAMAHARRGDARAARDFFDRANRLAAGRRGSDPDVCQILAEAHGVLAAIDPAA